MQRLTAFARLVRDVYRFLVVREPRHEPERQRWLGAAVALDNLIDWALENKGRFAVAGLLFTHLLFLPAAPVRALTFGAVGVGVLVGAVLGGLAMFSHLRGAQLDADLKQLSLHNDGLSRFVITGETPVVELSEASAFQRFLAGIGAG